MDHDASFEVDEGAAPIAIQPERFPHAVYRGDTGFREITLWSACDAAADDPSAQERRHSRALQLRARLRAAGIPCAEASNDIVPVVVGDPIACESICEDLLEIFDIHVDHVADTSGAELLCVTPTARHSDSDIEALVAALTTCWDTNALERALA